MKKIFFIIFCFGILHFSFSQQPGNRKSFPAGLHQIAKIKENSNILTIKEEYRIPAKNFFEQYQKSFAFQEQDRMVLINTTNTSGITHYRYNQYYKDIPVQGAVMILHERNGNVYKVNGNFINNLSLNCQPAIDAGQAVENAIKASTGKAFAWQVPGLEKELKLIKNDENATYYPTAKLTIYDRAYSFDPAAYRLAYEVEIFSAEPLMRELIYVDAKTGAILYSMKKNTNVNVEVQAETRYNGIQTITVDSVSPTQFVLRSDSRGAGNGILTKSMNNTGSYYEVPTWNATLITEPDNYFNTDKAANSAHFGAEKTYDYFYTKFGRNSFDDNGSQLVSYVHWGSGIGNAMWSGNSMIYGDGSGNSRPFTLIEICGHEITHGVTEYSANLIYEYESGALNEAFSDMFGSMIYQYATGISKWTIGDEIGAFRNMSNPNQYQNPDTYRGDYWQNSTLDNGGVHCNSGVANYWFYLLTESGQGTNDLGNAFNVTGLGAAKSERIAYETLTGFLTPSSNYHDAYLASLEAAADLYGECSEEYSATANAWYAVGIGNRFNNSIVYLNKVVAPVTACVMSDREEVRLDLLHNDCNDQPLAAGSEIHVKIVVDPSTIILDTVTLASAVQAGDYFTITLNKTLNLAVLGEYHLNIFVKKQASVSYTDSIVNYQVINRAYQNTDVGVSEIVSPAVSSCQLDENTTISAKIIFNGCDFKAAGDTIRVAFTINNSTPVVEKIILQNNFTPQDTLTHTFTQGGDFTLAPKNTLVVYTENSDDTNPANNRYEKILYRPVLLNNVDRITFSETPATDYFFRETGEYASATTTLQSGYPNGKVLKMTGGNIMEYISELQFPEDDEDFWALNAKLSAKATFCVDARDLESLSLHFDLKQTSGKDMYQYFYGYFPYDACLECSSMMRILVNGNHVGNNNYIAVTASGDPYTTRTVDLSSYVGNLLDVTFEGKCMGADMEGFTLDNIYLDNISITGSVGIRDMAEKELKGLVYPNPGNGNFTLAIDANGAADAIIDVLDLTGRKVFSQSNTLTQGQQYIPINLNRLESGIYMITISSKVGKATYKVVKH